MSGSAIQKRYDEFQLDAVNCVFKDFQKKSIGRYLLVIPAGGGKTFTAVKSVNRLFEDGVLCAAASPHRWRFHFPSGWPILSLKEDLT